MCEKQKHEGEGDERDADTKGVKIGSVSPTASAVEVGLVGGRFLDAGLSCGCPVCDEFSQRPGAQDGGSIWTGCDGRRGERTMACMRSRGEGTCRRGVVPILIEEREWAVAPAAWELGVEGSDPSLEIDRLEISKKEGLDCVPVDGHSLGVVDLAPEAQHVAAVPSSSPRALELPNVDQ